MKMHYQIAILLALSLTSCSTPSTHVAGQPKLPDNNNPAVDIDEHYGGALRCAERFFLVGPMGQDSMRFAAYSTLVDVLADVSTREEVLKSFYYNGTVEAKAFCLFGLRVIGAPAYESLKRDFLALPATYVTHHYGCLILKQTPQEIVRQIETDRLYSKWLLEDLRSLSRAK